MIEYVIWIVMVIFATGFAWLWFIEQKKKRFSKRRLTDSAQANGAVRRAGDCVGHMNEWLSILSGGHYAL